MNNKDFLFWANGPLNDRAHYFGGEEEQLSEVFVVKFSSELHCFKQFWNFTGYPDSSKTSEKC